VRSAAVDYNRGYYWQHVERWWASFPVEQLLVLDFSRLADATGTRTLADAITEHIGIAPFPQGGPLLGVHSMISPVSDEMTPQASSVLSALYAPHNALLRKLFAQQPSAKIEGFARGETFRWLVS
jgi:hypothetical protein